MADANGRGDLAVVLDEVRRDRRVGPSRAGPLAAGEIDLDGVGFGDVQDLVDDSFGFFASIHGGGTYESSERGSRNIRTPPADR